MEEAARLTIQTYCDSNGVPYFADDVDDLYERFYNWPVFHAMGGSTDMLTLSMREYESINQSHAHDTINPHYPWIFPQLYNEYYSLQVPKEQSASWIPGQRIITDWHHMGEGNMAFYDFGVADPTIYENARRAQRFAGMYIGEDAEAPNWDPVHKIIRSPINSSQGPHHRATLNEAMDYLHGGVSLNNPDWKPRRMGSRSSLYPIVEDLQFGWWDDSEKAAEVVGLFNDIVLNADLAANLSATGLVTNAYLYTGDEKYKKWVLDYVDAWLDRSRKNGGIIPDNVGPTGKVGENRNGVWYGGLTGWSSTYGYTRLFHSVMVATECAVLLSGDLGYTELMRSQIKVLLDNSFTREDGHLLVPVRYTPDGWAGDMDDPVMLGPRPLRVYEPAHVYHMSMSVSYTHLTLPTNREV